MSDSILKHFDVIIIGGGPSGVSCALGLKNSGLKVAILDKSSFPRDKICGDAIPGRTLKVLYELDPNYLKAFDSLNVKERIFSTLLCSTKRRANVQWVLKAYNCTRVVFDNFLLNLVRQETNTTIFENTKVTAIETSKDLVNIETSKENYTCSLVVACDGAQSVVAKRNAGFTVDREHYCSAVRAYYENISGSKEGRNEIYFSKKKTCLGIFGFSLSETTNST